MSVKIASPVPVLHDDHKRHYTEMLAGQASGGSVGILAIPECMESPEADGLRIITQIVKRSLS